MLKRLLTAALIVLLACALSAQEPMTNDGVIKLVKANMSEDLILNIIRQQPGSYALGASDLVGLKEAGISERIIAGMLAKSKLEAPTAADPGSKAAAEAANSYQSITSPGLYYKKGNDYFELITEEITWKTSGALKHIASAGIVKKDLNGTLGGPSSRNFLSNPVEILINLPPGFTVNSYILLPMKTAEGRRDFLVGPVNKKSGVAKGSIAFGVEKLGNNLYRLVFQPSSLPPGEYGILAVVLSDAATTTSRMYSFRILI